MIKCEKVRKEKSFKNKVSSIPFGIGRNNYRARARRRGAEIKREEKRRSRQRQAREKIKKESATRRGEKAGKRNRFFPLLKKGNRGKLNADFSFFLSLCSLQLDAPFNFSPLFFSFPDLLFLYRKLFLFFSNWIIATIHTYVHVGQQQPVVRSPTSPSGFQVPFYSVTAAVCDVCVSLVASTYK